MNLYAGKLLVVDLNTRQISEESLREEWLKEYWGCWGLAVRYYWDLADPTVDPLSPENPMIIMTGPLGGTSAPMTSRFNLVSKSPHTGTIFSSNTGGAFGPELKFAGYDGIIIKGAANEPTYLKIMDDQVSLESARSLAGKGIFETEELLQAAVGTPEAKVIAIGPAGENMVTHACIGTEAYRQMGRGGGGAIFGSKKLKAIVVRGTGGIKVADMPAFIEKVNEYKKADLLTDDNLWAATDGTPMLVDVISDMGGHPTRNFSYGVNDAKEAINSDAIKAAKLGDRACSTCPLACGKFTSINGAEMEGPEYETLCLAGSNCEINDLEQVILFNRLCDDLGLDTISCGNIIGLAMDMTEKGRHDFNLKFGEPVEYLKAVTEIATLSTERGRDLALGAKKLAAKYDSLDLCSECKGLEFPAYEPRVNYGIGLAYATAERGGCHMRAFTFFSETPFDLEAMARDVIDGQNFNTIKWSMGLCDFWATISAPIIADILSVATGETVTAKQLEHAGEKIWNILRLFNLRAGITKADDYLPVKQLKQQLQKGEHAGRVFPPEDFNKCLALYYQKRGWDENGIPTPEKLAQLGLDQF
ncbi:MAG: aldehyde ferredoxin oxidoreductase family protein [Deltaproteobacteria bacterium]|nr:aldehyde ferredoxin oxidoreductase family protein [Deltaproteobacteria bacterium]